MLEIQHGKKIISTSYYEGEIASQKEEVEVSVFTDKTKILRDVIEALSVISDGTTSKLNLCIQIDSQGRYRLIKRWAIN